MAYKLHYSDYPGTDTGPPDPERWVGPAGPPGPPGPPGPAGPVGPEAISVATSVIDYGADPSGVADSTAAFSAALATGKAVWAPTGHYHLANQIVVGAGQTLYGDGRGSTILTVGTDFSSSATGVISLTGRELAAPILRDFQIAFTQTSTQAVRANFRTLAAGGNLTTGIMYPPAIIITSANRFRLSGLAVSGAWDGIINPASNNNIGGYFIDDIEMGALNVGLAIDNANDAGHIKSWHGWNFGLTGATFTGVYLDGNTYAAKFGVNGNTQALFIEDFFSLEGAVSIDNSNTWIHIVNLGMDGTHARFIVTNCLCVLISTMYISGGASPNPQISVAGGGVVSIDTLYGGGWVSSSGALTVISSFFAGAQLTTQSLIRHTGGNLWIKDSYLNAPVGLGAWTTVPLINSTGGSIWLENNILSPMPAGTTQLGLSCLDQATNVVIGNTFNGWAYTPGANLSGGVSGFQILQNGMTAGLPNGGNVGVFVQGAAARQRQFGFYTAANQRWGLLADATAEGGSNAGSNFAILRFNDAGVAIDAPLGINRATGHVTTILATSPSYATDAAAAGGGVAVGELYRNGSVVQVRVT